MLISRINVNIETVQSRSYTKFYQVVITTKPVGIVTMKNATYYILITIMIICIILILLRQFISYKIRYYHITIDLVYSILLSKCKTDIIIINYRPCLMHLTIVIQN